MDTELKDRVALVTGASSGIGRATAVRFAAAGARVALVGRQQAALAAVGREIVGAGGAALVLPADVTDEAAAARVVAETVAQFGGVDVLVNGAGIIGTGTVETTTLAAWDEMLNVNLRAAFQMMQLCVPHLKRGGGNIVNVSSVTGVRAFPGVLAYCVSKAGLDQLTRCTALELAPAGVRVNAVNPGVVSTGIHMRGGMAAADYEVFLERSKQTHPLGRVGTPAEVAELILFLASDRASWITGVTYEIDGGRAQTCAR